MHCELIEANEMKLSKRLLIIGTATFLTLCIHFFALSSVEVSTKNQDIFALTLTANSTKVILNGQEKNLSVSPFIQGDAFYYPLQEVIELLGGTFSFSDRLATIDFAGNRIQYRIGSLDFVCNGVSYHADCTRPRFIASSKDNAAAVEYISIDSSYVPIQQGQTVYLPLRFSSIDSPDYDYGINSIEPWPELQSVIIENIPNESSIIGDFPDFPNFSISLFDDFTDFPTPIQNSFVYSGITGNVLNYNIKEYKNDNASIYLMDLNSGEDSENLSGKICGIKVTGNKYRTARGLQVGDPESNIYSVYGLNSNEWLLFQVEGGRLCSFTLKSRYFEP